MPHIARKAKQLARRVAALCAQGFLACARSFQACERRFLACTQSELAGTRAPVRDLEVSTALVIVRTIQIQTLGGEAWERVLGCWGGTRGCRGGMAGRRWVARRRWAGVLGCWGCRDFQGGTKLPRLASLRREAIANQLLASMGACGCRWIRPTCGDLTCWSNCS
jgi:hypothetical protein